MSTMKRLLASSEKSAANSWSSGSGSSTHTSWRLLAGQAGGSPACACGAVFLFTHRRMAHKAFYAAVYTRQCGCALFYWRVVLVFAGTELSSAAAAAAAHAVHAAIQTQKCGVCAL